MVFCWVENIPPCSEQAELSVLFLHALPCKLPCLLARHALADVPCSVCLPWSLAVPRGFFYRGGGLPLLWQYSGLVSLSCECCWLLRGLTIPLAFPCLRKPPAHWDLPLRYCPGWLPSSFSRLLPELKSEDMISGLGLRRKGTLLCNETDVPHHMTENMHLPVDFRRELQFP